MQQQWSRPVPLTIQVQTYGGCSGSDAEQVPASSAAQTSPTRFIGKMHWLLQRFPAVRPVLCKAAVSLKTVLPAVLGGEITHRLLVLTRMCVYIPQQLPDYESAAMQLIASCGDKRWHASQPSDKMQHLRVVYLGWHPSSASGCRSWCLVASDQLLHVLSLGLQCCQCKHQVLALGALDTTAAHSSCTRGYAAECD